VLYAKGKYVREKKHGVFVIVLQVSFPLVKKIAPNSLKKKVSPSYVSYGDIKVGKTRK
jgi:hypothetical protein